MCLERRGKEKEREWRRAYAESEEMQGRRQLSLVLNSLSLIECVKIVCTDALAGFGFVKKVRGEESSVMLIITDLV